MIAPAHRYPTQISGRISCSTWQPMALRRPPPIEDPLRAWHALGHALHLGGTSRQRGRARVAARLGDDDSDGHRYEFGADLVAVALLVLNPTPLAVDQVVESGDRDVEALRDLVRDRLGTLRLSEDDEVVAPDVAREVPLRRDLLERLEDDRGQRLDHVVAAHEAVMVVVALERVDVRIEDRKAFLGAETLRDLAQDVGVAAHPRQGIELACGCRTRYHRAQARHQLFWDEGL